MSIFSNNSEKNSESIFQEKSLGRDQNGLFHGAEREDQYFAEMVQNKEADTIRKDYTVSAILPEKPTRKSLILTKASDKKIKEKFCQEESDKVTRKSLSPYKISLIVREMFDFAIIRGFLHVYIEKYRYWKVLAENDGKFFLRKNVPDEYKVFLSENSYMEIYKNILVEAPEIPEYELLKNTEYLNFRDCAISWRTCKVVENPKHMYFLKYIQVDAPRAFPDKIKRNHESLYYQTIYEIFGGDKELMDELEKFYGLALSNIRDKKISVFFYGGSNTGKTVLLTLLKQLVGKEFVSSISFSQLGEEFAVTQLIGKTLNLIGETSGVANKRLDIFKSLTGNDTITVCFKGKDHFQFDNQALLCFACNEFPDIAAKVADSFSSRIVVFLSISNNSGKTGEKIWLIDCWMTVKRLFYLRLEVLEGWRRMITN